MPDVAIDRALAPLSYHQTVLANLKAEEPHAWAWTQSEMAAQEIQELRDTMLRDTYRLEAASHPDVFAACATAMERLGLSAPVTLYQANDGTMNASLVYVPGEIHLIFFGPILERLDEGELLALLGHELSHYLLWSLEDGAHYRASRVFDHALSYPAAKPSHRETARLLSQYTELFADRGAAIAAGQTGPVISLLVKVMTGLTTVDPDAFLRQAEEVEAKGAKSRGASHPEAYLRARALRMWWDEDAALPEWMAKHLHGPLSIESLDVMGQHELTRKTRAFLARFVADLDDPSDEILTQVTAMFPDFGKQTEEPLDLSDIAAHRIDDATRDYFIAVMFDLAMADSDAVEATMQVAAKTAAEIGASERLSALLRRDLKWPKARVDKLLAKAAKAA